MNFGSENGCRNSWRGWKSYSRIECLMKRQYDRRIPHIYMYSPTSTPHRDWYRTTWMEVDNAFETNIVTQFISQERLFLISDLTRWWSVSRIFYLYSTEPCHERQLNWTLELGVMRQRIALCDVGTTTFEIQQSVHSLPLSKNNCSFSIISIRRSHSSIVNDESVDHKR